MPDEVFWVALERLAVEMPLLHLVLEVLDRLADPFLHLRFGDSDSSYWVALVRVLPAPEFWR
jgi:hypothetical protein